MLIQRPESVRTAPVPFRHPHFQSFTDRQHEAFRDEIAAFLRNADDLRARLAAARVLEVRQ